MGRRPAQAEPDLHNELLEGLRNRVLYLEEADRENRRIIAGLIQRVPELEPPRDEPHGSETVFGTPEGNRLDREAR